MFFLFPHLMLQLQLIILSFLSDDSSLNEDRPTPSEELFLNYNDRNSFESVIDPNGIYYSAPLTHKKATLLKLLSKYTVSPNDTAMMVTCF